MKAKKHPRHKWETTGITSTDWCRHCGTIRHNRRSMKTDRLWHWYEKPDNMPEELVCGPSRT